MVRWDNNVLLYCSNMTPLAREQNYYYGGFQNRGSRHQKTGGRGAGAVKNVFTATALQLASPLPLSSRPFGSTDDGEGCFYRGLATKTSDLLP